MFAIGQDDLHEEQHNISHVETPGAKYSLEMETLNRCSVVFIVNFEHFSHIILVFCWF